MSAKTLISVEAFDRLEEEEFRYELDEGKLITLTRPRVRHARIEGNLYFALRSYLEQNPIGEALGADILYVLSPMTKRAPDVSRVFRTVDPDQEIQGAPDIAAEVISPSNTRRAMQRKLGQFFTAGCKLAWIIDPKTWSIEVWESASVPSRTLQESECLETPLLPGFKCPLTMLFGRREARS
jgi:Uma2 family endonuclease